MGSNYTKIRATHEKSDEPVEKISQIFSKNSLKSKESKKKKRCMILSLSSDEGDMTKTSSIAPNLKVLP